MSFNRNILGLCIVLIVALSCGIGYVFFWYFPAMDELKAAGGQAVENERFVSALDGTAVAGEADVLPRVVAVMIDNHPGARPSFGLTDARVVYEAPVEGEFTRYMAVYDSQQEVVRVGSVRSARPYFLDWLEEYGNALYMHSGGSPEALSLIDSLGIADANEFYWGNYYWRTTDRDAPHNLFTSSTEWQKIISRKNASTTFSAGNGWPFAASVGRSLGASKEVKITFSAPYVVSWKYDEVALDYVRYVNGTKQLDADGREVRARNVLMQYVAVRVTDEVGRKAIATVGNGDALILRKGESLQGKWEKLSRSARTRFYNLQYQELTLVPGTTWVEIVPENAKVEITN